MSKRELIEKLNRSEFDGVLDILLARVGENDPILNSLHMEFLTTTHINNASFMMRLRLYINTRYVEPEIVPVPQAEEPDYYNALCNLDFELQTNHFENIYRTKKVSAFLLHGESDEEGKDILWLYNQLIHRARLSEAKTITIDLKCLPEDYYGRILEEFWLEFEINKKPGTPEEQLRTLRSKLEGHMTAGHCICVVKHPKCVLDNEEEIHKLHKLFAYMEDHIEPIADRHLLFLFIEHGLAEYCHKKDNFFFVYKDDKDFAWKAIEQAGLKIIDLAPVKNIVEPDIKRWTDKYLGVHPNLHQQLKTIRMEASNIIQRGSRPYQVIEQICMKLNIPIQHRWTE